MLYEDLYGNIYTPNDLKRLSGWEIQERGIQSVSGRPPECC